MAGATSSPRSWAAARMALANGCSESVSAAAASASTSSRPASPEDSTAVTAGVPLVSVPVLSKRTTSTLRIRSSAKRSLIRTPLRAACAVARETTSGIASPSACGQAMTRTVMTRTTDCSGVPTVSHTIAVRTAVPRANQNSRAAALSATRCARDEEFWASSTSFWIPARAVSSPIALMRTRIPESVATVPATTVSPSPRRTVRDSPVIIDSSMLADPSRTTPSAGMLPPGRTITTSSTRSSSGETVSTSSPTTRSASSGSSAARESSAELVWASERISTQ